MVRHTHTILLHFLDFKYRDLHTSHDVRKEGDHIVVAHRHVGDDFLERIFLSGMVFVLLAGSRKFLP